ncbi:hypothetical protein HCA21_11405 [Listeria seeligeri]|uniref:hypothetical protein n=1 Tax=Listeria seeligeri TaxID=1640 RepID=UPI001624702B|nr:hypothetical protein [Listeria seeligeri]EKM0740870.1 hypothetical protein [Listeria monocytogenes]EKM1374772.1 hypothetical protein [Listeria monocytogenes]MBC1850198.1 hypothetical protein [Listeria seeligeri]MBC1850272.1 hypothetical protein [Listeria seeligeri]MBF2533465.1 hypothetical protein [Listeria seeligeri]
MAEKKNNATKNDVEAAQTAQKIPKSVKKPLDKFGKKEVYTATDGTEYEFQFPGTREGQRILDESTNVYGRLTIAVYNENLMDIIITKPEKLDWKYWDEHEGYSEVMNAADNFLARLLN